MVIRKRAGVTGRGLVFVTTTVRRWSPIFLDKTNAVIALDQLSLTVDYYHSVIIAYVLMPSHLHALLGLENLAELSKLMGTFKSLSSRRLIAVIPEMRRERFRQGTGHSIWMPRFDDLVVWSPKQFQVKINYIHNNPVKAGIARSPESYPHSSAVDWLSKGHGMIPVCKDSAWSVG